MLKYKKLKGFTPLNEKVGNESGNNKSAAVGSLKLRKNGRYLTGFTLIELLVVIAIMGLLATFAVIALDNARQKARDARRLSDMTQIQKALELYFDKNGSFSSFTGDACCGGWDQGPCDGNNDFISGLASSGFMPKIPVDPKGGTGTGCYGYSYYVYNAGDHGCVAAKGRFYVLGVRDMETSGNPYPTSPGWSCPGRNWQTEFEWVAGKFEKE